MPSDDLKFAIIHQINKHDFLSIDFINELSKKFSQKDIIKCIEDLGLKKKYIVTCPNCKALIQFIDITDVVECPVCKHEFAFPKTYKRIYM